MSDIVAGTTVYKRVVIQGSQYAVLEGKTLQDTATAYSVKIEKTSGNEYFVNLGTKSKMWELPQLAPLSWKEKFVDFYSRFVPEKVDSVESTLSKYPGREEELWHLLLKKYEKKIDEVNELAFRPTSPASQPLSPTIPSSIPPGPSDARTIRDRIVLLYQTYRPKKLHTIDALLEKYLGQEEFLLQSLISQLGPEPVSSPVLQPVEVQRQTPVDTAPQDKVLSVRKRVTRIYSAYAPSKLNKVDEQLQKFAGNEEALITALVQRYGPEPQVQDNTAPQEATAEPQIAQDSIIDGGSPKGSTREHVLLGFLQDREQRLESALQRNSHVTSVIEDLRQSHTKLLQDVGLFRQTNEEQMKNLKEQLERVKHDSQLSQSNWMVERSSLQNAVATTRVSYEKEINLSKIRFEEESVKLVTDKCELQAQLVAAKEQLHFVQQKSSDLLMVLDKSELTHADLLQDVSKLQQQLRGTEKVEAEAQTDAAHLLLKSEGDEKELHQVHQVIVSFDRQLAKERYRRTEIDECRKTVLKLEGDLLALQNGRAHESVTEYNAILERQHGSPGCNECLRKMKSLRTSIESLRTANRSLESKISDLELKLLSQPPDRHETSARAREWSTPEHSNLVELHNSVADLTKQLSDARAAARTHKKEICDLRGLLASHMSSPFTKIHSPFQLLSSKKK